MSADEISSPAQADAPVPADASRAAITPDAAKGQHDGRTSQPAETRTRQEHADATRAGPPARSPEAPGRSAPPDQQARQPGRATPEHGTRSGNEGGSPPPERRAEVRTRQEHADAMLTGLP